LQIAAVILEFVIKYRVISLFRHGIQRVRWRFLWLSLS